MFSLITPSKLIPPFQTPSPLLRRHIHRMPIISAVHRTPPPPPPPGSSVYQPFRPPPAPAQLPSQYHSLALSDRLEILRNRLGLWHEYAPLIPTLTQDGCSPPSIEEATGISNADQNLFVVAAQVRDSLISLKFDADLLAYFDVGGAELLYELRLLSAAQRATAARHVVDLHLDPKATLELARAMKDFPRRRDDPGWGSFSAASPGDCLAFTYLRMSVEATSPSDRVASLQRALDAAETESAKTLVLDELERRGGGGLNGQLGDED
ncbi:hypothetical protein QJS10_CPB18g01641 [Acorus calamus]|uniref:Rubisco LSMT substrate-binding domain-containing protein n=1 Tax=Acorus calamus TaxID=4465 RepID=A0AAV9CNH3_ACOCL|nr:hypothetical protein QJS10_CPB18g01641 [Acorus calamus]